MTEHENAHGGHKGRARQLFTGVAVALLTMVAVFWAWKKSAVVLFDLPEATFVQIAAIIIALTALLYLARSIFSGRAGSHERVSAKHR